MLPAIDFDPGNSIRARPATGHNRYHASPKATLRQNDNTSTQVDGDGEGTSIHL